MLLLQGLLSCLPRTHASMVDNWKADLGRTARTWLHVLIGRRFKNSGCFSSSPPSLTKKLLQKNDAHQVTETDVFKVFYLGNQPHT